MILWKNIRIKSGVKILLMKRDIKINNIFQRYSNDLLYVYNRLG